MILLVQLEKGMERLFLPLGLLYVADALRKKGATVEVFHRQGTEKNIGALVEKVKAEKPSWVGFSTMTAPQLTPTIEASKRLKAEGSVVVWGGIHPTMVDGVDREWYVDYAVRGEGEAWASGRPVLDMDEYHPAWDLVDPKDYGDTVHLVTSRGCPHRCAFCYSPAVWKRRWKCHSVGKVVEIFRSYPSHPKSVEFRDDYFFANPKRATEIVNRLKVPWLGTIRAPDLTSQLLDQLEVLPTCLQVGVESASARLLKLIQKDITFKDVENALEVADAHGIQLYCTFIVSLPTETPEEKLATIELSRRIREQYRKAVCLVKAYRCYPGTELYDLSVKMGFKPPCTTEEWAKYAEDVWSSSLRLT